MILSEREKLYIDMRLAPKTKAEDFQRIFSESELSEFRENSDLQDHYTQEKLKMDLDDLDVKRKTNAKKLLELENIEKIMPLAYKKMVEILSGSDDKSAAIVLRMLFSGKLKYLERFAEIQANKDNEVQSAETLNSNKYKLSYNLDDDDE